MKTVVYKKILLTHDASQFSCAAIPHAVALAKACKAEIFMLQIVNLDFQIAATVASADELTSLSNQAAKKEENAVKTARNRMEVHTTDIVKAGVDKVSVIVKEGRAADEIVSFAKKNACDLIVMSTHGHSGLVKVLLGSVADEVVRYAPCPVLLIHPKQL